jgi:catechol 2,3-dioxygenase-like lactoylglutathione lyase family enzyme
MRIEQRFPNLVVDDPATDRAALEALFDLEVAFESEWYVQLRASGGDRELGLLRRGGPGAPACASGPAGGTTVTVVVEDVDALADAARGAGIEIVEPPVDRFYGQRQLLLRLPGGAVLDLSAPCAPDPDWMARVRPREAGGYSEGR